MLVCGEGRLNAFRIPGETHIPALVVNASEEDAFIVSLAENIARRGYRPWEILADIEVLGKRGYSVEIIIPKTGLSPKYFEDIVFLLDQGEESLIKGVQRGTIPLTTALEIARANENATEGDGQANLGELLQEAYENSKLKGRQIIEAKRLIEKRLEHGPASPNRDQIKPQPPATAWSAPISARWSASARWSSKPSTPTSGCCWLSKASKSSLPTSTSSTCRAPKGWTPCPSTWRNASTTLKEPQHEPQHKRPTQNC